jgi:hypothetical protein
MEVHEDLSQTRALNLKTPGFAKQNCGLDEGESPASYLLNMSTYSPFFKADNKTPITDIEHGAGVLVRLDEGITMNNEAIMNFIHDYRHKHGKAGDAIRALWLHLEALSASMGVIPTHLASDYLAHQPAWASIGAIATKIDDMWKQQVSQVTRLDGENNGRLAFSCLLDEEEASLGLKAKPGNRFHLKELSWRQNSPNFCHGMSNNSPLMISVGC